MTKTNYNNKFLSATQARVEDVKQNYSHNQDDTESLSIEEMKKLVKRIRYPTEYSHQYSILNGLESDLIRKTVDDILKKSKYLQPELAVGCIFAFLGALCGRRYKVGAGLGFRTNVSIIGLAGSGEGKSFAVKYMMSLFYKLGLGCFIAAGFPRSAEALKESIFYQPSQVLYGDEIGFHLKRLNMGKAPHLAGITQAFTELYDKSSGTIGIAKTIEEMKKQTEEQKKEIRIIRNPCLSLYLTSTEIEYFSAINPDDFFNGTMNRNITIPIQDIGERYVPLSTRRSENSDNDSLEPSSDVLSGWQALKEQVVGHNAEGDYNNINFDFFKIKTVNFKEIEDADDQELIWEKIKYIAPTPAIYARGNENTCKIAALIAITNNPNAPAINRKDLFYAHNLVKSSCLQQESILDMVKDLSAKKTPAEMTANRVLDKIKYCAKEKGYTTPSEVSQQLTWLKVKERDAILASFEEGGVITRIRQGTGVRIIPL